MGSLSGEGYPGDYMDPKTDTNYDHREAFDESKFLTWILDYGGGGGDYFHIKRVWSVHYRIGWRFGHGWKGREA